MTTSTIQKAQRIYQTSNNNDASSTGEWIQNPSFHETRKALGKSFAGTDDVPAEPLFNWAAGHLGDWFFEDDKKACKETMMFWLAFPTYAAKKDPRGMIISKRDKTTAEVVSAAIVLEYDPHKPATWGAKLLEEWRVYKTLWTIMIQDRIPDLFANKKYKADSNHFEKKFKHFDSSSAKWHKDEGPKEIHWYLQVVGVTPTFNRQGRGRELMEKVHELADEVSVKCYLECGPGNRGFYEKMGYRLFSAKELLDPLDDSAAPLELFIMIRSPTSRLSEQ